MRTFALTLMASAASAMQGIDYVYMKYLMEHGKSYQTLSEYSRRYSLFLGRYQRIQELNEKYDNFTLGLNKMSDWTQGEISKLMGYLDDSDKQVVIEPTAPVSTPASVDWRDSGCETPVKDQGHCGSCWTFATMESVESAWCIATGELPVLATQQLVDCVGAPFTPEYTDDAGCNGGWTYDAYDYLTQYQAIAEEDYPYTATDGTCKQSVTQTTTVGLSDWTYINRDVSSMKASVAERPMAVSIQADQDIFHAYTGGIIDSTDCGYQTDHAVVVVGYGTDADTGLEFWIVRNSWGTDWGEDGFARVAITDYPVDANGDLLGICGIGRRPLTALV